MLHSHWTCDFCGKECEQLHSVAHINVTATYKWPGTQYQQNQRASYDVCFPCAEKLKVFQQDEKAGATPPKDDWGELRDLLQQLILTEIEHSLDPGGDR